MGGAGKKGDGKCCACTPGDPDGRWPGVGGSPIMTDRGYAEYDWGERGDTDDKNPVSRDNQPKPCCPCKSLLRFKQEAENRESKEKTKDKEVNVGNIARFQKLSSTKTMKAMNAMKMIEKLNQSPTSSDSGSGVDLSRVDEVPNAMEETLHDMQVSDAAANEWTSLLHQTGEEKMTALRLKQANDVAHNENLERDGKDEDHQHNEQQYNNAYDKAESTENGAAMAAARLQTLHRERPDLAEGPAMEACRFLGPEGCKQKLDDAVGDEQTVVTTAIRLLRHGRAGSLCDQVGRARCHETLGEARERGHRSQKRRKKERQRGGKRECEKEMDERERERERAGG